MLKLRIVIWIVSVALVQTAFAQESPPSGSPPLPEESPSPTASPELSVAPSPITEQTPPRLVARSVRISFVPPPLDGTISVGIYDRTGKLVRVLHQQANLSEFTIGADALVTQWDGKNDNEEDVPGGRYRARGYAVGNLRIEALGNSTPPPEVGPPSVRLGLVANPLLAGERQTMNLGVGFDEESSFLKTMDGLPLFTIEDRPNVTRASIKKATGKAVDVWTQNTDGVAAHFHVSNVDKMMAFDCGELELK
jgi:hypothetical protein